MLHQGFPHCAISPTAASRRSLGRVSVPMWPFNLSVRLPIVDLVGRYPTNYLIGRGAILQRIAPFIALSCDNTIICGISVRFQTLSPSVRQVPHALLTRPPLSLFSFCRSFIPIDSVRLACVRHAASVRPEPGSNSLKYCINHSLECLNHTLANFFSSFFELLRSFRFFTRFSPRSPFVNLF